MRIRADSSLGAAIQTVAKETLFDLCVRHDKLKVQVRALPWFGGRGDLLAQALGRSDADRPVRVQ